MATGKHPPPVINEHKPTIARSRLFRESIPTQTAWMATLRRTFKDTNARYVLLWLTGGVLFCLFGKPVIRRREEDLVVSDIENYLANKQKKASE
jgi:hypothetical protein